MRLLLWTKNARVHRSFQKMSRQAPRKARQWSRGRPVSAASVRTLREASGDPGRARDAPWVSREQEPAEPEAAGRRWGSLSPRVQQPAWAGSPRGREEQAQACAQRPSRGHASPGLARRRLAWTPLQRAAVTGSEEWETRRGGFICLFCRPQP